jgi:hypothetical protein
MILALLLAQAAPLPAAPPGPPAQPPATLVAEPVAVAIAGFDADGDARVTRAEMEAGVRRSYEAVDTTRSGSLGYIGFADWAERYLGNRSALPSPFETDANGDDRISLAELEAKFAEIFARLDRDRDGVLTRTELLTIRADAGRSPDDGRKKKKK